LVTNSEIKIMDDAELAGKGLTLLSIARTESVVSTDMLIPHVFKAPEKQEEAGSKQGII
jgi:hypothetical protein